MTTHMDNLWWLWYALALKWQWQASLLWDCPCSTSTRVKAVRLIQCLKNSKIITKKNKKTRSVMPPKEHLQAPSFFWKVICFSFYRFALLRTRHQTKKLDLRCRLHFQVTQVANLASSTRHTRKGPLQDFWAKDTTPLRAIRFSFSEMKHWCEARTPTTNMNRWSLTIMNRYLVTDCSYDTRMTAKKWTETFLPADGAAMTDTLLIDK